MDDFISKALAKYLVNSIDRAAEMIRSEQRRKNYEKADQILHEWVVAYLDYHVRDRAKSLRIVRDFNDKNSSPSLKGYGISPSPGIIKPLAHVAVHQWTGSRTPQQFARILAEEYPLSHTVSTEIAQLMQPWMHSNYRDLMSARFNPQRTQEESYLICWIATTAAYEVVLNYSRQAIQSPSKQEIDSIYVLFQQAKILHSSLPKDAYAAEYIRAELSSLFKLLNY